MTFSFPQVNTTKRVMKNGSEALCSTDLFIASTYAICILPAAHKCGNIYTSLPRMNATTLKWKLKSIQGSLPYNALNEFVNIKKLKG